MPDSILAFGGIMGLVGISMVAANILHDHGLDSLFTRRLAGTMGGFAYLVAILALDTPAAFGLSASMTIGILVLRATSAHELRGVTGDSPTSDFDWITFPLAGTLALAIGWGALGDRWLAFVPIAFMAWGDNAAGLVRAARNNAASGLAPSAAMLAVCLITALLFPTYWIGACGAVVATLVERFRPTSHPLWDDNVLIVGASLATMAVLLRLNLAAFAGRAGA